MIANKVGHNLESGDYVELLADFKDEALNKIFPKGTIAEVVAINMNFSADLMDEENGFMYNVPYSYIEYIDEFEDDGIIDPETPLDWSKPPYEV